MTKETALFALREELDRQLNDFAERNEYEYICAADFDADAIVDVVQRDLNPPEEPRHTPGEEAVENAWEELGMDSEWRDISSAPRDGTHVLLYYGPPASGGFMIGAWLQPPGFEAHWCDGRPKFGSNPTHWMPLPVPPRV